MSTKLTVRQCNGITVIVVRGRLVLDDGAKSLQETVELLISQGTSRVLVNMSEVPRVDSTGLGVLIAGYSHIDEAGGEMKLTGLRPDIVGASQAEWLRTIFEVYEDEPRALASFGPAEPAAAFPEMYVG